MEVPDGQRVEPVLHHHVQQVGPELRVPAGLDVGGHGLAGAIGIRADRVLDRTDKQLQPNRQFGTVFLAFNRFFGNKLSVGTRIRISRILLRVNNFYEVEIFLAATSIQAL